MIDLRSFDPADFAILRTWATTPREVYLFAGSERHWPLGDDVLTEWLALPNTTAWTAVLDADQATPIGHIELVRTGPTTGRLARVLLDPAKRGKGYGRALTAAAMAASRAAGVSELELNVITGNAPAVGTYRSLGFQELGANPEHPDMTRMRTIL